VVAVVWLKEPQAFQAVRVAVLVQVMELPTQVALEQVTKASRVEIPFQVAHFLEIDLEQVAVEQVPLVAMRQIIPAQAQVVSVLQFQSLVPLYFMQAAAVVAVVMVLELLAVRVVTVAVVLAVAPLAME
jgi:aromatic ring-opening dioxygenase LigB subunit